MKPTDVHSLASLLEPLYDEFADYNSGRYTAIRINAYCECSYVFADEIVIPLQAHYFAMEGLAQAMGSSRKSEAGT